MRIVRIAAVATRVVSASALTGAVLGVLSVTMEALPEGGALELWREMDFIVFVAMMGALVGVIFGPIAAWLFMPQVPLWRVMCGPVLGIAAGSLLGGLGPLLGFGAAMLHMLCEKARKDPPRRRPGRP